MILFVKISSTIQNGKMEKIKTIGDFIKEAKEESPFLDIPFVQRVAIEFAKYHVELALTKASKEAEIDMWDPDCPTVDEGSILNAYPLSNIK